MKDDIKLNENLYLNEEQKDDTKILSILNAEEKEKKKELCEIEKKEDSENLLSIDNIKKSNKRIIIEKLVLENFKSYSGTKIIGPFYKKFSCIVGPNGSGKSNIIDAMLFVFGRRAKKIRQNKLSDLIHNSKYSMNNNYTKVSIYFKTINDDGDDNEDTYEKETEYENTYDNEKNYDNFIISREATIDNQSKYRINEKVVNQKEVVDLLYKKGIDLNNNRFLILQGEVEQIAQMNPKGNKNEEGLLEYLEDIIGTNAYIEKINENFEKLEKSEEIYHEKVNRLKHVYNELKELSEPKKEAKYYICLQKYTYKLHVIIYKKEQYESSKVINNKEEELQSYIEKRDNHNKEYKDLLEERKNMNIALSNLENEEEDIMRKKNKADNEFKKLTTEDENIKKELLVIVEKMQNLYVKREELKEKKIPLYKKIVEEKQKLLNDIKKNKLPKLEKELEICEEELEKYNEEIKHETDKINTIYSNEEKKLAPLQNSYDVLIKSISECANKCNIIEKKQKEYLSHIENLKYLQSKILNELKEKDIQLKHMIKLDEEKKKVSKEKQKDLNQLEKSIENLNDKLIQENVKYESIKKEVITDKTKSKLHEFIYNLKKTKIKGIHGMLGDLGYIDKKYEKAFIIAGNNCSDFIIVENPNDAVLLFEEVRKENLGRVNVLSLSILEKNLLNVMIKNEENYKPILPNVHRLIDFIKFKNEKYKICFYFALKETLLANTLDEAHVIGYSHKKRVVTLSGELIENDGRICGGGLDKYLKGNISSIKTSEYDETDLLNSEKIIKELNKNLEEKKKQKNMLLGDIKDLNTFIEDNECKAEIAKKTIDNYKKQLKDIDDQLQNSETPELTKEEEKELKSLKELIEEKNNEKSKIEIVLKAQENKVKKYYEELQNVGGEKKKQLKSKYINAERQLNILKDELEKHNNEEVNALANLEKSDKDIIKFTEEIAEYEANEKDLENELKNIETKGCEVYEEIEKLTEILNELQTKIEESQKKKQQIDESISKKDLENVDIVYKIEHIEKEIEQYKAKNKHYEFKINEYLELINESDKIIQENLICDIRGNKLLNKKKKKEEKEKGYKSEENKENEDENEEEEDEEEDEEEEDEEEDEEEEEEEDEEEEKEEDEEEEEEEEDVNEYENENEEKEEKEEEGKENEKDSNVLCDINKEHNKKRKLNNSNESKNLKKKKKKKKKLEDDDELKELEDMFCDNKDFNEIENEYDNINLSNEELESLNKKDIESKLENKLYILEKKTPNLKIFQDYNLKLYDYKKRRKDVKKAKKEKDKIKKVYDSLCNKRREEFLKAFNIISVKLKEMYQMIAIGGDAELEIIDSSEIFNEGILFSVRPPKKSWKHIQNLSGGEKTLSSLALVFALHYFKPNPIYFMDEIDAALDFKNVSIISHYIKTKTSDAQFIVISLRNQMFELCDRMIGIYKTNDITKCITLNPNKFQEEKKY